MWEETKQDLATGWVALQHLLAGQNLHVPPEGAQEWRHVRCKASQNNTQMRKQNGFWFCFPRSGSSGGHAVMLNRPSSGWNSEKSVCWLKSKMVCLTPRSGGLTPPLQLLPHRGVRLSMMALFWSYHGFVGCPLEHTHTHTPWSVFTFTKSLPCLTYILSLLFLQTCSGPVLHAINLHCRG